MGQRGPIPKRSEERTRRHATGKDGIEIKKGIAQEYSWTKPGEDWPDFIVRFYESFSSSGMAAYYQQSDVEQLWMSCEMLARQFETGRPSAMMVAEAIKLLDGLGATEGERRRMKIELEAEKESDEDAKDAVVTDIQSRLRSSAGAS